MLACVLFVASFAGGGSGGHAALAGRARLARARPLASTHEPAPGQFAGDPSLPPSLLANAWGAADTAAQLAEKLKGCSVHLIGHRTGISSTAALAFARRLQGSRYRFLDLDAVVQQLLASGADAAARPAAATPSDAELREVEHAVLEEAKAWSRSILFAAGRPASDPANWAALHQGVCVLLLSPPGASGAGVPDELWVEQADVTVQLDGAVRHARRSPRARTRVRIALTRSGPCGAPPTGAAPRARRSHLTRARCA